MFYVRRMTQRTPTADGSETGLTRVRVCGTHHNHRGADASGLSQAQPVVLLLGEHRYLVIGIVHIYDHLQGETFTPQQLYMHSLRK